jgi:hypothetical protein
VLKETEDTNSAKRFYFLKLKNNGTNSCFSNSNTQMFFSCGEIFFVIVMDLKCKSKFCVCFRTYISLYRNKSCESISSRPLRATAMYGKEDPNDSYIDGSQQCFFLYFLDLIRVSCERIQNIFKIDYTERKECSNCKYVLNNENVFSQSYISVTRSVENEIDFQNLFNPNTHCCPCLKCGCTDQLIYVDYVAKGNFVILRIQSEDYVQRFYTKIKNINLNESITIPNLKGNFTCKSLIVHETNGLFGEEQRGHYRCFSKIETASDNSEFRWLNISDEKCTPMRDYPVDLENVFIVMLQKQSDI